MEKLRSSTYNLSYLKEDGNYLELVPLRMKSVPGFDNYYCLPDGRIFSVFGAFREMKPSLDRYGYLKLNLFNKKKKKDMTVHRVIALTFIPNPYNKSAVNHKDGNKLNNNADNLEWTSDDENTNHATLTGMQPCGITNAHSKFSNIVEVSIAKEALLKGFTTTEIARYFRVSNSAIGEMRRGISYRHIKPFIPPGHFKINHKPANDHQKQEIFELLAAGQSRTKVELYMRQYLTITAIRHVFHEYDKQHNRVYKDLLLSA